MADKQSAREALTDAWEANKDVWHDYTAAMVADWSAFADHEHTAVLGVIGDELAALETACGVGTSPSKGGRRYP